MSYYIDPWLYNCTANPADSPAEQREQRLVIEATQRAIDYARARGVTTIAAEGNGYTDLGKPVFDDSSPDYPVDETAIRAARPRTIDNSCKSMPTEADGVIGVTSVGPSKRKAYYSDYGVEQADVAAPGGDTRDTPDGSRRIENAILAAYPYEVGIREDRELDGKPDIDPSPASRPARRSIKQGGAYYQWIQGTSMAAPHAVGVAALIVAEYGQPRPAGRRSDAAARPRRADPEAHGHRRRVPGAEPVRVPGPARAGLHGHVRGRPGVQRVLRRGHRRRARRRAAGPRRPLVAHPPQPGATAPPQPARAAAGADGG